MYLHSFVSFVDIHGIEIIIDYLIFSCNKCEIEYHFKRFIKKYTTSSRVIYLILKQFLINVKFEKFTQKIWKRDLSYCRSTELFIL